MRRRVGRRDTPASLFRRVQQALELRPPAKGVRGVAGFFRGRCGIKTAQDQIPRGWPAARVSAQEHGCITKRPDEDGRRSGKLQRRLECGHDAKARTCSDVALMHNLATLPHPVKNEEREQVEFGLR